MYKYRAGISIHSSDLGSCFARSISQVSFKVLTVFEMLAVVLVSTCCNGIPAANSAAVSSDIRGAAFSIVLVLLSASIHNLGLGNVILFSWHQIRLQMSIRRDILQLRPPILQIILCIIQDLTSLIAVLIHRANIARYHWGIIEKVENATSVSSEDDLFLGTFDGCGKLGGVCLLQLLTGLERLALTAEMIASYLQYWSTVLLRPSSPLQRAQVPALGLPMLRFVAP
jgi:hypothetical protein